MFSAQAVRFSSGTGAAGYFRVSGTSSQAALLLVKCHANRPVGNLITASVEYLCAAMCTVKVRAHLYGVIVLAQVAAMKDPTYRFDLLKPYTSVATRFSRSFASSDESAGSSLDPQQFLDKTTVGESSAARTASQLLFAPATSFLQNRK